MPKTREARFVVLLTLIAVAASTTFYSAHSLNHDSSWYLIATRKFMGGAELYRDIIEINPPWAFYLTVPALVLSDLLHLRPATAFFLYVSALGGLSVVWTWSILSRSTLGSLERLTVTGCAAVGCFLIGMNSFGQREHLMLIFAIPYFMLLVFKDRIPRMSALESAAVGLSAFAGLALKPYFLLIPAGIVLTRIFQRRTWTEIFTVSNVILGTALVAYVVFIVTAHPFYLDRIVPDASLVYSNFGNSVRGVLLRPECFAAASVACLAVLTANKLDRASLSILGGLAGAVLSYLVQFKGWPYQAMPLAFFTFLSAVWITATIRWYLRKRLILMVFSLISIELTLGAQFIAGAYDSPSSRYFEKFVYHRGMRILVLSSNVSHAFPFVNQVDGKWTSSYPAQWLLPGAISKLAHTDCRVSPRECSDYKRIISRTRSTMVKDFVVGQPELVFIDDRKFKSYYGGISFDYLDFLRQDPAFARQWTKYKRIGRSISYEVWARDKTGHLQNQIR